MVLRYLTIKYSSSAVKTESAQVYSPGFVRGPFTMANLQISIILQCGYSEIFIALVLHIDFSCCQPSYFW